MRLVDLLPGETGMITKILGHGAFRKRVMEMGFVRGREVKCMLNAPLMDPVKYALMDYEVSLRRNEASMIEIMPVKDWHEHEPDAEKAECNATAMHDEDASHAVRHDKIINVALLGNPNCGKTSLFNKVSGANEHVGNYAGVTVDAKSGHLNYKGYRINVVDLPGTYSLSAYSPEEQYVVRYLRQETPDVMINVIVASNLERNLYLTTELIDMNRPMVIALNMYDELEKSGVRFHYKELGDMLGVPVIPTVASTGRGVEKLLDTVIEVYEMRQPGLRHIHVKMSPEIEEAVDILRADLKEENKLTPHFATRYLAIKLLEGDPEAELLIEGAEDRDKIMRDRNREAERIEKNIGEDVQTAIAANKYGFIQGALAETLEGDIVHEEKTTRIIDALVTSRLFGFPIFLAAMFLMFWATFQLGSYPMEWIENLVGWISELATNLMPEGPVKDLLLDGIIGGVGGVIVFLPNILILYFFISFMEDSGYMARVAFIMDRMMHKMGLHGKSFIPLVAGFGCNVPAVMATRIIESRSSRIITILILPFMSCSARLPIYVLLVGAFFPTHGDLAFFSLYLLGIVVAILTAKLLRRFWFKADETPFVMELPPYRVPTFKAVMRGMWSKAKQYLQKMGGLILVASVIIWVLSYFPRYDFEDVPQSYIDSVLKEMPAESREGRSAEDLHTLVLNAYQQEHSILGGIGKFCRPVVAPLDLGWKACVALIAGMPAKEVVVSTLGVLYVGDDDANALSKRLKMPSPLTGEAPFNPASAIAFLVFVLLYFPCIATLVAIVKETGNWKYGLFSLFYNTGLAWVLAYLAYRMALVLV